MLGAAATVRSPNPGGSVQPATTAAIRVPPCRRGHPDPDTRPVEGSRRLS
jgi:hypothetical protein